MSFTLAERDMLRAYASANPNWKGEFTEEVAERLAGSRFLCSTQVRLVKKFYEDLRGEFSMYTTLIHT